MKLFLCSDTHGANPPDLQDPDAVAWLHAGDVYHQGSASKEAKAHRFGNLTNWISAQSLPVYAVHGNHDCYFDMPFFQKAERVSGRCIEIAPDLLLAGFGWHGSEFYDLPLERDMQKVCAEVKREWLMRSMPNHKLIFLSHYPPWVPEFYPIENPKNYYTCLRELVDELKPIAVVQGHEHQQFKKVFNYEKDGHKSLFVYPGNFGGVLEIADDVNYYPA